MTAMNTMANELQRIGDMLSKERALKGSEVGISIPGHAYDGREGQFKSSEMRFSMLAVTLKTIRCWLWRDPKVDNAWYVRSWVKIEEVGPVQRFENPETALNFILTSIPQPIPADDFEEAKQQYLTRQKLR